MFGVAGETSLDFWLGFAVAALVGLAPVLILIVSLRETGSRHPAQHRCLVDILRERYARGELTTGEYFQRRIELLNDCYARGELKLNEYQARLDQILPETRGESTSATGTREQARLPRVNPKVDHATRPTGPCERR